MNPAPKAIFFDLDGTILDHSSGREESWLESCEKHHDASRPHTPAQLHAAIRTRQTWFWDDIERQYRGRMDMDGASREIVRHAFADLGVDAVDVAHELADYYRARRSAAIAPYPGAIETLRAIRERGIAMALITNGEAGNQRRSVEQHALAQYFDCIVIEGEFDTGKPDERVFRHALSAVGSDPAQTWMVGDDLEADIATPHRLGMHTVWVDAESRGLPEAAPVRPHRIVRSIAELL